MYTCRPMHNIKKSVDFLCRDGKDTPLAQYDKSSTTTTTNNQDGTYKPINYLPVICG